MQAADIKKQLHEYIESADDNSLEAMYAMLGANVQQVRFSEKELSHFRYRRNQFLSGNEKTYSVEEAHSIVRQSRKKGEL